MQLTDADRLAVLGALCEGDEVRQLVPGARRDTGQPADLVVSAEVATLLRAEGLAWPRTTGSLTVTEAGRARWVAALDQVDPARRRTILGHVYGPSPGWVTSNPSTFEDRARYEAARGPAMLITTIEGAALCRRRELRRDTMYHPTAGGREAWKRLAAEGSS
jgi:hypothetical protein